MHALIPSFMKRPFSCVLGGVLLYACSEAPPPAARVLKAEQIGIVEQSPAILGRDGAGSTKAFGHSVWVYGDTVLTEDDAHGTNWHHNSFSITADENARDGISGFVEPSDDTGAPLHLIAPTPKEQAFNDAHHGEQCAKKPCGARYAVWPGSPVYDPVSQQALIFYGLLYGEPGEFNFDVFGYSVALWKSLDSLPERPVIDASAEFPDVMFGREGPAPAAVVLDHPFVYIFACELDYLEFPCTLSRVPFAKAQQPAAWEHYDGQHWQEQFKKTKAVVKGNSIMSISYNRYLRSWMLVYASPLSQKAVLRTAPNLTGPWSEELKLFSAKKNNADEWTYDVTAHTEYEEQHGKIIYVTYSRPAGERWFQAEVPLWRVELE